MGLLKPPAWLLLAAAALAPAVHATDWELALDLRAVSSDGRESFLDNGLGKLRFDEDHQGLQPGRLRLALGLLTSALDQLQNLITDFGPDRAQLVLDVEAMFLAQGEQVFALHAQFARQSENAHLVFILRLQAELPFFELLKT